MRVVLFDDGAGARLGVVRKNHVVDARLALGITATAPGELTPVMWHQLRGLDAACPTRAALRRIDQVRILAECDAPISDTDSATS